MAEKTPDKPKTHAEAKAAYDALAKQCTDLAARMPKVRAEIERRVKEEVGKAEVELTALKARKAAAAVAMRDAEERERPEAEAREAARVAREAEASMRRKAEANAKRQAELAKVASQRSAEATK